MHIFTVQLNESNMADIEYVVFNGVSILWSIDFMKAQKNMNNNTTLS